MKGEGLRTCLDCRQPIIWVQTTRLYMVPIDPEPSDDGNMAITGGDPPTVRYLWNDAHAEEHEWIAISHLDTCTARERRPPGHLPEGRSATGVRRAIDLGYTPGLLSGHPGPCAVCCQVTEKLVTDHCHRHGQVRGDVCMSCNHHLGKADALFWQGDIVEIHASHLDHLRRCERCVLALDHMLKDISDS
jgi:hypothetical protein